MMMMMMMTALHDDRQPGYYLKMDMADILNW